MSFITAVVFDLDGTLIDSALDLATSVNYVLKELDLPERSHEEIKGFVGDGVQKLIIRSLGVHDQNLQKKAMDLFLDHYEKHLVDYTQIYPGVKDVLDKLNGKYTMGVLTNKKQIFTEKIVSLLELHDYFDAVIGGDTLATKKPNPEGLIYLAKKWKISTSQIFMVGDHATDIQAGKNAGCKTVYIAGGIGETRGLVPDFRIQTFSELPNILGI